MVHERYEIICEYIQAQSLSVSQRRPAVSAEIKSGQAQLLY
jgi:hypothetical protein